MKKKRAQPEQSEPAAGTPTVPKTAKATPKSAPNSTPKDTPKAQSVAAASENSVRENGSDSAPAVASAHGFVLKKEQEFLRKLVADQNPRGVLSKQKRVEECLKVIATAGLSVDQLRESKLGLDLQQFVNICGRTPLLSGVQKNALVVLNKLKQEVIYSFFGEEELPMCRKDSNNCDSASLNSAKQSGKVEEETKKNPPSTPKSEENNKTTQPLPPQPVAATVPEPAPASVPAAAPVIANGAAHPAAPEPERVAAPAAAIATKSVNNSPQNGKKAAAAVAASAESPAKEPSLMIMICQEIARLLEEVWVFSFGFFVCCFRSALRGSRRKDTNKPYRKRR